VAVPESCDEGTNGIPIGRVDVAWIGDELPADVLEQFQLVSERNGIEELLVKGRLHSGKSHLELGGFQVVDAPYVQFDSGLLFQLFGVVVEVLITSHEEGDHAQAGFSEPGGNVFPNVLSLSIQICGHYDVLDTKLSTDPGYVSPSKIGYHPPVIGEGYRVQSQYLLHHMQYKGAVPAPAEGDYAVWLSV